MLRAGIADVSGIANIADIADIADIAMGIADIVYRYCGYCRSGVANIAVETGRRV